MDDEIARPARNKDEQLAEILIIELKGLIRKQWQSKNVNIAGSRQEIMGDGREKAKGYGSAIAMLYSKADGLITIRS